MRLVFGQQLTQWIICDRSVGFLTDVGSVSTEKFPLSSRQVFYSRRIVNRDRVFKRIVVHLVEILSGKK